MLALIVVGLLPLLLGVLSGCAGPRLTIVNESSAWLRFNAASEVDARQAFLSGPLAGDGAVAFGVPPGARHEQALPRGGSILVQRRLGVTMSVQAGPNPASGDVRNPSLQTAYSVWLPPPGPYVLRVSGQPGILEITRVGLDGSPMGGDRASILPTAAMMRWELLPRR